MLIQAHSSLIIGLLVHLGSLPQLVGDLDAVDMSIFTHNVSLHLTRDMNIARVEMTS